MMTINKVDTLTVHISFLSVYIDNPTCPIKYCTHTP